MINMNDKCIQNGQLICVVANPENDTAWNNMWNEQGEHITPLRFKILEDDANKESKYAFTLSVANERAKDVIDSCSRHGMSARKTNQLIPSLA